MVSKRQICLAWVNNTRVIHIIFQIVGQVIGSWSLEQGLLEPILAPSLEHERRLAAGFWLRNALGYNFSANLTPTRRSQESELRPTDISKARFFMRFFVDGQVPRDTMCFLSF